MQEKAPVPLKWNFFPLQHLGVPMAITSLTQRLHLPHLGCAFPPPPARQREFIPSFLRISTRDPSPVSRFWDLSAPDGEHAGCQSSEKEPCQRQAKGCRLSPLEGMSWRGCERRGAEQLSRWEALIDLKQGRHGGKREGQLC